MRKHLLALKAIAKENALFLLHYRRNKKRSEQELEGLEIKMEIAQIELAFAMRAEQKARKSE